MKTIRSPENPGYRELLQLVRSARHLRHKGLALLEGQHLIESYVARHGCPLRLILSEAAAATEAESLLVRCAGAEVWQLSPTLFRALAQTVTPSGSLALVSVPRRLPEMSGGASCLLLEDIQDPGNVGVLLRIGAAAGIRRAYLSPQSAYAWSAKTLRAGQGAHFFIEVADGADLEVIATQFPGRRVAAVVRGGTSLFAADLHGPVALMFGNEGAGLSPALSATVDLRVTIPMPGGIESLNVATAAAVVIFEKLRQDLAAPVGRRPTDTAG